MSADHVTLGMLAATFIVAVLRATTPILLAALGGLISDLAGSINVALEGLMLIAAFFGVIVAVHAPGWFPGLPAWASPWIGCAAGLLAALLVTGLMAVFHLELGADLIVAGIAINILAAGLTVLLLVAIVGDKGSTAGLNSPALPSIRIPGLSSLPVLDLLLNGEGGRGHHVLLYVAFAGVAATAAFLSHTRHGLWIRAVGENPRAALGAGIPVKRVRYLALLLSGLLAGLGGIYLSMGYLTLFQADMTAGRGFLALAAIFLGRRRPLGTFGAALLFGASSVLATRLGAIEVPTQIVYMLPPFITICALVIAGRRKKDYYPMNKDTIRDRTLASLTLAGMGDALGAPTEQWGIDEIAATYGGLVTTFRDPPEDTFAGANRGRRAEVTDDASQMYYLARALIAAGGRLDYDGWVTCLLDWVETSPKAGFMGPSTAGMVQALKEGSDTSRVGIIGRSNRKMTSVGITNGAAMRVAPVGLVFPGRIERACTQVLVTCLPSHDTDVAISAACSVAGAVARAMVSSRLEDVLEGAVEAALLGERLAKEHARAVPGPNYRARLDMALRIAEEATGDYEFMKGIERVVGNSVLAAESVPAALALVLYARGDAMRTISLGASMGNDTDSIATMAGAIVGALVGTSGLPQALAAEFREANTPAFNLDEMATGLSEIAWRHIGP